MALITYQNKVTLNENSSVEAINKVQASDMNEIKNVVNGNWEELAKTIGTIGAASGSFTIGNIGVEWGTVTVEPTSGSSPSYYGSASVTFVNTYTSAPGMFANLGAGFTSVTNVATINVTTTGGNVWMTASATTARTCRYLVIGIVSQ
jgi:hypothetical protein